MLAEKTNKTTPVSGNQTRTTQQQQQSDLRHLSLAIQQFSSQLNLLLSQQQHPKQQKHSDMGDTIDYKQDQSCYSQQHQQQKLHGPTTASHHPPFIYSHANACTSALGSCSKLNTKEHYCHSTCLSPSLSTLLPLQCQYHYAPTCLHDSLHQTYSHHNPFLSCGYEAHAPPPCPHSIVCCHQGPPHQCTTASTTQMDGTTSSRTPTGDTTLEHPSHHHHHNAVPSSIDSCATPTGTPLSMLPRFKSTTDPLPPIPNDDNNDNSEVIQNDSSFSSCADAPALTSTVLQSSLAADSLTQEQLHEISWTDLYRQDILAKKDTLMSSYNNLDSLAATEMNEEKKENKKRATNSSRLRGWWSHGKYKWKQLRKKSVAPLIVSE